VGLKSLYDGETDFSVGVVFLHDVLAADVFMDECEGFRTVREEGGKATSSIYVLAMVVG
jgi:hypothetical protein